MSSNSRLLLRYFIKNALLEASLDRSSLNEKPWRYNRFIEFIQTGKPFKVGAAPPYRDEVLTLQIKNRSTDKVIYASSDLVDPKELSAFKDWMVKGPASKFSILPVWDGTPNVWKNILKDPQNFQYEKQKSGSIQEKALTPSALGLADFNSISISDVNTFKLAVKGRFDKTIEKILLGLIDAAYSGGVIPSKTKNLLGQIDDSDKRKMIVDFGEVLSAIMEANRLKFTKVRFPDKINEPLIDFELAKGKGQNETIVKYSAKGLSGSASSMKNYFDALQQLVNKKDVFNKKQRNVAEIILSCRGMSLHDQVLKLSKSGLFGDEVMSRLTKYTEVLSRLTRSKDTSSQLVLDAFANTKKPWSILKKYYKDHNYTLPKLPMHGNLTSDKAKSLMIYPILRSIMREMNAEGSPFKEVFAKAINQFSVSQAFTRFDDISKPTQINVNAKPFSGVLPESVAFQTKASSMSFSSGGIGVEIKNN